MESTKMRSGSMTSKVIIDFLIDIPMFDKLEPDELGLVTSHMNFIEGLLPSEWVTFIDLDPGEILFREGDPGDYVCFIAEGSLDVMKETKEGRYVTLATLSKGRSIGEMAIIDDFPRSATVKGHSRATLIILTRKGFDLILEKHPRIGVRILGLLPSEWVKMVTEHVDYPLGLKVC